MTRNLRNKSFEPFQLQSKCCKESVKFFRGTNVGYPKCEECGNPCDIIEPKNKSEKFQYEIESKIKALDYYVEEEKESRHNFEKMELLREVRNVWQKIYIK